MRNIYWVALAIFMACKPPDHSAEQQVLMDRRLQDKINQFIADEMEKCTRELLTEASATADSVLRATNPILIQIDSIERPPKPPKPPQPNFERPKDSIVIAPIIPAKKLEEN